MESPMDLSRLFRVNLAAIRPDKAGLTKKESFRKNIKPQPTRKTLLLFEDYGIPKMGARRQRLAMRFCRQESADGSYL